MRLPFLSMFMTSPFAGIQEHAEKVQECAWAFQQAMECHVSSHCQTFEELRQEVSQLESEADAIKRRIRGHLPIGTLMPVSKFQLFRYLREQDGVLDAVEDALDWISYRQKPGFPEDLSTRLQHLVLSHHGRYEFGSPILPMGVRDMIFRMASSSDATALSMSVIILPGPIAFTRMP